MHLAATHEVSGRRPAGKLNQSPKLWQNKAIEPKSCPGRQPAQSSRAASATSIGSSSIEYEWKLRGRSWYPRLGLRG